MIEPVVAPPSDYNNILHLSFYLKARSLSGSGSSEADLSNKLDQPVANSTFNDTNKGDDYLGSSEDSVSIQVKHICYV